MNDPWDFRFIIFHYVLIVVLFRLLGNFNAYRLCVGIYSFCWLLLVTERCVYLELSFYEGALLWLLGSVVMGSWMRGLLKLKGPVFIAVLIGGFLWPLAAEALIAHFTSLK